MSTRPWLQLFICVCILPPLTCVAAYGAERPGLSAAAPKQYDLYLLIGQSNMAGRGKVDKESTRVHPRVVTPAKDSQWALAIDPLHFDKPDAGVGPGLTFGKTMADASPKATIGRIPCAVGGTSITRWAPGGGRSQPKRQ